ncbi:hypothetical protein [Pueribacillus theae]|uniref:hypothetical protein n=1 Tax=Pueribacillus theae TaxID=2171751 RepID=UPI001402FB83|nr:hypothetical protein [Pueribacillus theae]
MIIQCDKCKKEVKDEIFMFQKGKWYAGHEWCMMLLKEKYRDIGEEIALEKVE